MRIIAGLKRGMRLLSPRDYGSRPITDRVKESLFSVLLKYDLPAGARVADLFCGVGSLGLEALSRGASFVTFVEHDAETAAILERNIDKAGFVRESKVIRADAFRIGAPAAPQEQPYDLVFVDPPYADTSDAAVGSALGRLLDKSADRLTTDGIVVVRTHRQTSLLDRYGRIEVVERRQWSKMCVTILQRVDR